MDHNADLARRAPTLLFDRLVFFSDAVFAISITLLVLDLKLPAGLNTADALAQMGPKFEGVGIGYCVVGIYWLAHHRLFGTVDREDPLLRFTNLLFLAGVIFLPFPASVIAERQLDTASAVFYAASAGSVGVLFVLLALVARRHTLLVPGSGRRLTLSIIARSVAAPLIFFLSIPLAFSQPQWAVRSWILIWPMTVLFRLMAGWAIKAFDAFS